ncbi:hypothetical protein T4B_1247 [Trichinella pseudospiralis]|uniref:PiggyBac transposable element-derived protein 4 C-terminal zinc-ribbon domain-containing protein n=1 Tax=Trichinella pseudospiralis TaxID=6337 RepID=A0A0V1DWF7_TRIPS|nr:hypothetical protein T4A_7142 [Trichinella pseudospiralis]KRZ20386.1 hypothetical protein T4B_1247 [Trichinella pseudospiralis]
MSAIGMERHKIMQAKAISARMWEEPCGKHPPEASSKSTTIAFSLSKGSDRGDENGSGSRAIISNENRERYQKRCTFCDRKCSTRCSSCTRSCCSEHLYFFCKN